jgi:hypothetical protein
VDDFPNSALADRFIVISGAMKQPMHNLFGKLGINPRTQALVCAPQG